MSLDVVLALVRKVFNKLGRVSAPPLSRGDAGIGWNDGSRLQNDFGFNESTFQNRALFSNFNTIFD